MRSRPFLRILIAASLLGTLACGVGLAEEPTADSLAQRQAAALARFRKIQAEVTKNKAGEVIAVRFDCTVGLWDDPQAWPKEKWLFDFAADLQAFPHLEQVEVADWVYGDDDLQHLGAIPQLMALSTDDMLGKAPPFTGAGLRHLVMPASLRSLSVYGLDDQAMRYVGQMSSLRSLNVGGDAITSEGWKHLSKLKLESLTAV